MSTSKRYSPEVRERAVRLVFEHAGEHDSQWAAIGALSDEIAATLPWFDALLDGRDFLLGDRLGVFDVVAFPFLKYGVITPSPDDPERFHTILHEHLPVAGRLPRLGAWIARVDARWPAHRVLLGASGQPHVVADVRRRGRARAAHDRQRRG